MIDWQLHSFEQLSTRALFDAFELRQRVFVLEQQCLYPDIDATDLDALHLLGYDNRDSHRTTLCAYLRLIKPRAAPEPCALGRIATSAEHRGQGIGKQLLTQGIGAAQSAYPDSPIRLSAQTHLEFFYREFGFKTTSMPYVDDGISHIDMLRDTCAPTDSGNQRKAAKH